MSSNRSSRVESLFEEALDYPESERDAFLKSATDHPEVREQVEALLHRFKKLDAFLETPAVEAAADFLDEIDEPTPSPPDRSGERVGPFTLKERVGRGGSGVVYRAEREDSFEQQVAIKLLTRRADTSAVLDRFAHEQQVLAALTHPCVAQIYDGGATADGQPYFVMEYVAGRPLDEYCDDQRLSIRERLELFTSVSDAVHHAHQNLVIHRDLKPSNILVTADGRPKLLDFGIAKVIGDEGTGLTQTGERWMTPEYAAPEQIRGESISTATDVYQLGVVLYELLIGRRPYHPDSRSLFAIERAVCEEQPTRPSTAVTQSTNSPTPDDISKARRTHPSALQSTLRGDLDAIVMKALRKEPKQRYRSAEAMVADIQRFLNDQPVEARDGQWSYRAHKFIRRHTRPIMATAAVLLILATGAVAYTMQIAEERDRARLAEQQASTVTGFLVDLFNDNTPRNTSGQTLSARDILRRGETRMATLDAEPRVRLRLLLVLAEVRADLNHTSRADSLIDRAEVVAAQINDLSMLEQSHLLYKRGEIKRRKNDYASADSLFRLAQQAYDRSPRSSPDHLTNILNTRMETLQAVGDLQSADSVMQRLLPLSEAVYGARSTEHATILHNASSALTELGHVNQAESAARTALDIRQEHYSTPHIDLAYAKESLGSVLMEQDRTAEAKPLLEDAVHQSEQVLDADNDRLDKFKISLALLYSRLERYTEAEKLYLDIIDRRERVNPNGLTVLYSKNNLALTYQRQGRYEKAASVYREVLDKKESVVGHDRHPSIVVTLFNLASALHEAGELDQAESRYRRVVQLDRELLGESHREVGVDMTALATLLVDRGALVEADSLFERARPIIQNGFPDAHRRVGEFLIGRGSLFVLDGRPEEAEPLLRRAVDIFESGASGAPWRRAEAKGWLGTALLQQGNATGASFLDESRTGLEEILGADHWRTARMQQHANDLERASQ
ncbi:hypothetical protein CRI94_16785 [Longibacter salinarum]|uniref:Protein kinase domain-containing protein n=1 Tax=Longibacter salinarum TaxID=1850348 RepID=A0A2A8CTH2_9BACT|nr:serine/threonine-protein kinase [Longibacter salinarum]PEN11077.1 hypothetical protein CRI94_16785 [Longibacter salinarum]